MEAAVPPYFRFGAIVIASGVAGCCAAAVLARQVRRVLLVEKRAGLGGSASTSEHKGVECATDGLTVALGGPMEAVCAERGVGPARAMGSECGLDPEL